MTRTKITRSNLGLILTTAVFSLALSACGGGGGDSSDNDNAVSVSEEDDPVAGLDPVPVEGDPVAGLDPVPEEDDPVAGSDPVPEGGDPIAGLDPVTEEGDPVAGLDPVPPTAPVFQEEPLPEPPPSTLDNFVFQFDQNYIDVTSESDLDFVSANINGAIAPLNSIDNVFFDSTVPVIYGNCGEPNAFYAPAQRFIGLCDELTMLTIDLFQQINADSETGAVSDEVRAASVQQGFSSMAFVMYHEMGHALDDIRDLIAIGGNFESVADAIGAVLSVQTGQPEAAVFGGLFFLNTGGSSFTDEHGAGEDRAGDILCWVTGGSPALAAALPDLTATFAAGGRDCIAEYANQQQFVEALVPNFADVPVVGQTTIASARSRYTKPEQDRFAVLDKLMADVFRQ